MNTEKLESQPEKRAGKIPLKRFVIFLICVFLFGCTMEGEVDEDAVSERVECTDTRDGEVFMYDTKNVIDIRVGLIGAPSTFTVIDTDGVKRNISTDHEAWLKCVVR